MSRVRELDRPDHPYWTGPLNRWLIAGSPLLAAGYPCRCRDGRRCTRKCPCRGRLSVGGVPERCCGRVT